MNNIYSTIPGPVPLFVPVRCQILPSGVLCFDECYSPPTIPAFDLFLPIYGVPNVDIGFIVDKPVNLVPLSKPVDQTALVFGDATTKAVGYAGIDGPGAVGHDVDEVAFVAQKRSLPVAGTADPSHKFIASDELILVMTFYSGPI